MIGFIITLLASANLGLGSFVIYYKDRYEDSVHFMEIAKDQARQAEEYSKLVKLETQRNIEILDEKNKLDIDNLNAVISRMRQQANRSIVSSLPTDTKSPGEICFKREELDSSIQQYRNEILALIGKGESYQIDLETAKEWVEFQQALNFDKNKPD